MSDRKKVIGHLNDCMEASRRDNTCVFVRKDIVDDALALLKEREAVKPKIDAFGHPYCTKCKVLVYETWEFCPHCGQELKWNA